MICLGTSPKTLNQSGNLPSLILKAGSKVVENSKKFMSEGDIDGLSECITNREKQLKGPNRAKLCHVGEFDKNEWFAGERLNYRFKQVKDILEDIFKSIGVV